VPFQAVARLIQVTIDSHHHFWRYTEEEYGWIDESMAIIRRDFLPGHLQEQIKSVRIDGVVSVQARQTLEETRWLLTLAAENDFIKAVVGWVPLIDESVSGLLRDLTANSKLRAIRHVLQGESDERYMLRDDFNAGIRALAPFDLAYDILIFERQLPQTIEFVDRHPSQVFVLDHIAKPRIKDGMFEPWNRNIREFAKRPNVFCKISGMVTEADWSSWNEAALRPYAETVLEAFGPARTMFGSDWPVCLVASGYKQWFQTVQRFASKLSKDEQRQLFGETAIIAYKL
jgi:L-fuconolactonase